MIEGLVFLFWGGVTAGTSTILEDQRCEQQEQYTLGVVRTRNVFVSFTEARAPAVRDYVEKQLAQPTVALCHMRRGNVLTAAARSQMSSQKLVV